MSLAQFKEIGDNPYAILTRFLPRARIVYATLKSCAANAPTRMFCSNDFNASRGRGRDGAG